VCDGHVFEGDVEFVCALEQVGADAVGDGFALGDEFGGVELRDNGFEDFVTDGGEDALVVVEAEVLWGGLLGRHFGCMGGHPCWSILGHCWEWFGSRVRTW
jgi:hypothetical protein